MPTEGVSVSKNKPPILPNLTCWQFTTFLCKTNPISADPKINLTLYSERVYEKYSPLRTVKSKPKQTQFKANSNPISAQTNPNKANSNPKRTQFQTRSGAQIPTGGLLGIFKPGTNFREGQITMSGSELSYQTKLLLRRLCRLMVFPAPIEHGRTNRCPTGGQAVFVLLPSASKSVPCPLNSTAALFFAARRYARMRCFGLCLIWRPARQSSANNIGSLETPPPPSAPADSICTVLNSESNSSAIVPPIEPSNLTNRLCERRKSGFNCLGQTETKSPPGPNLHTGPILVLFSVFIFLPRSEIPPRQIQNPPPAATIFIGKPHPKTLTKTEQKTPPKRISCTPCHSFS